MSINSILNFSNHEELVFDFPGKIGRLQAKIFKKFIFIWRDGHWYITNKRLIFYVDELHHLQNNFWNFGRPWLLIINLNEILHLKQEKTKIIIEFPVFKNHYFPQFTNFLSIGFVKRDRLRPEWIDEVHNFLVDSIIQQSNSQVGIPCPFCGFYIQGHKNFCPHCNRPFNTCTICKSPIFHLDEQIQCPFCSVFFHRRAFLEWMKIRGTCPNCNSKMNQHLILNNITL